MSSKKILVENADRDIVNEALSNQENHRLDILNFVVGRGGEETVGPDAGTQCNVPDDFKAYADSTYVKK